MSIISRLCSGTHEGHPMTMASTAKIVSPFPYPSFAYIAGANNGNPNAKTERMNVTAANAGITPRVSPSTHVRKRVPSPEAANSVNVSTKYV